MALGDKRGKITLHYDSGGTYAPSLRKTSPGLSDQATAQLITLDELIERQLIASPTIVKIDVEGAEGMVLEGMKHLLKSKKPPKDIFIEIHSKYLKEFGDSPEKIVSTLKKYGYLDINVWQRGRDFLCHFVYSPN